jgi:hypothetical protein
MTNSTFSICHHELKRGVYGQDSWKDGGRKYDEGTTRRFTDWSLGCAALCCIYTLLLFTDKNMLMRFISLFLRSAERSHQSIHPLYYKVASLCYFAFFCTILAEMMLC